MITRESWLKLKRGNKIDLEHLLFGLNLNKSINLNYEKLKDNMFIIQNSFEHINKKQIIVSHAIQQLDTHFHTVYIISKEGKCLLIY